jgi:hypothetical protein
MKHMTVIMVALLAVSAATVMAQEAAPEVTGETPEVTGETPEVAGDTAEVTGKVYLSGGETYEGVIEVAEFGVLEGAGIGTDRSPSNEYMSVQRDGEQVKVPVGDIATIEADWQQTGPEGAKKWQIESLTVTRKDGTPVTGRPYWLLHETTVRVRQADGTMARAHAFPIASADFDPGQLLVKVELLAVTMTPAEPDTTPVEPDTTPAEPDTTPAEPDTTPAEPDTTPAEPDTTPAQPDRGPGEPAAIGPPSTITLTVVCPRCGERITVTVVVTANSGE